VEKLDCTMDRSGCKRDCWENKKAKSESKREMLEEEVVVALPEEEDVSSFFR